MYRHLFDYIPFLKLNQALNMDSITCYFSEEEVKNIQLHATFSYMQHFPTCNMQHFPTCSM